MNLGLGNLSDVRTFVLPPGLNVPADTQYDSVLTTIARGVAERFGLYTNRSALGKSCLGYLAGDFALFDAHRTHYWLPRYPVVALTKLEMNSDGSATWSDITTAIIQKDLSIGFIDFGAVLGDRILLLRATYTGGFWFETLEPLQPDGVTPTVGYPSTPPAGAALLPDSLKYAWLAQINHEFQLKDRLLPDSVTGGEKHKGGAWRLDQMVLLPEVLGTLNQFRRMQVVA